MRISTHIVLAFFLLGTGAFCGAIIEDLRVLNLPSPIKQDSERDTIYSEGYRAGWNGAVNAPPVTGWSKVADGPLDTPIKPKTHTLSALTQIGAGYSIFNASHDLQIEEISLQPGESMDITRTNARSQCCGVGSKGLDCIPEECVRFHRARRLKSMTHVLRKHELMQLLCEKAQCLIDASDVLVVDIMRADLLPQMPHGCPDRGGYAWPDKTPPNCATDEDVDRLNGAKSKQDPDKGDGSFVRQFPLHRDRVGLERGWEQLVLPPCIDSYCDFHPYRPHECLLPKTYPGSGLQLMQCSTNDPK